MTKKTRVLIFGTSYMGEEYLKVMKDIPAEIIGVVGRDEVKAQKLAARYGTVGYGGGADILNTLKDVDVAIVATSVDSLEEITRACLESGIKNILVEKPGSFTSERIKMIGDLADQRSACVKVAFNRRFYSSVQELKQRLTADQPLACSFDFTEWVWEADSWNKSEACKQRWVLANSSHVIDTVFYLLGLPKIIYSIRKGSVSWHPSGSIFIGAGELEKCPFNYIATWGSSGRWAIEIATLNGRYKLSPMEELQFLPKKTVKWEQVPLKNENDLNYKPGLFNLGKAMLEKNQSFSELPDLHEAFECAKAIEKIAGYEI